MVTLKDPASFAFAQTTEPPRDDMSGLESHVHVGGKWKRSISRLAECTDCAPRIRDRFDLTLEWIGQVPGGGVALWSFGGGCQAVSAGR